jgi:hypothetical protein
MLHSQFWKIQDCFQEVVTEAWSKQMRRYNLCRSSWDKEWKMLVDLKVTTNFETKTLKNASIVHTNTCICDVSQFSVP